MLTMLAAIGHKLRIEFQGDPSLAALRQATNPATLVAQINKTTETDA